MTLKVERRWKKKTYTIGRLYINGKYFCNTLEDKDRGLNKYDSLSTIKAKKVYGETAIPTGAYEIIMDVVSPKFSAVAWYKKLCGGKMPRIANVPGYEGVLIHPGNTPLDTLGCILVGENKKVGQVLNSRATFAKLYAQMKEAHDRNETITLEIV